MTPVPYYSPHLPTTNQILRITPLHCPSLYTFSTKQSCSIKLFNNNSAQRKWRTKASFIPSFLTKKSKTKDELKTELFQAIAPLNRGAEATPEDQERVDQIALNLEALNSVKEPLKSDLINGRWELLYTTSTSILQTKRPKVLRPNGKIYQAISAETLKVQNMETWPFFNQAIGDLMPLNSRTVAVKWDTFKIAGLIPIKAPDRPVESLGQLEITYLDEEIRVSRGNRGNLFVLKMVDPSYRIPS